MESLHSAVTTNNHNLVLQMLQRGVNVNSTTKFLETPLHCLAKYWQTQIASSLLSHRKLEFDVHDAYNRTPLEIAKGKSDSVAMTCLHPRTNAIQVSRFYERFSSSTCPIFYWTRARNLLSTHQIIQTPLSLEALECYKKKISSLQVLDRSSLKGLEAKELKKRWKLVLDDPRFMDAKMHADHPLDLTNCDQVAWTIVHYLAEKALSQGIASSVDITCCEGVADLKLLIKEDKSLFFHCFIYFGERAEHAFVIERVAEKRYRILQSYINTYTLAELLDASAYPDGDLSRKDINSWLDSVQYLCDREEWTNKEQRLYRDLFHSSPAVKGQDMNLFFYASSGRTALMHLVEAGKCEEIRERLKDTESMDFKVQYVDANKRTILHLGFRNRKTTKLLLSYPEFYKYLQFRDKEGLTPRMYALINKEPKTFTFLSKYANNGEILPLLTFLTEQTPVTVSTEQTSETVSTEQTPLAVSTDQK